MIRALLLLLGLAAAQAPTLSFGDNVGTPAPSRPTEERQVLDELVLLDQQLITAREEIATLQAEVDAHQIALARHREALSAQRAALDLRRDATRTRVRALYRLERRGLARLVFGAEGPGELRRRVRYLLRLLHHETGQLRRFSAEVQTLEDAEGAMRADETRLAQAQQALQARQDELVTQRSARLVFLDDVRTQRELALRAEVELGQAQRTMGERLQTSAPPARPAASFRAAYGRLPWPTRGRVIRRFGPATDPLTGRSTESLGIDVAAEPGTAIQAVYAGVVTLAEVVAGYGLCVAVSHGDYTTVYAHAARLTVARGEQVDAGQTLGEVGDTGLSASRCCTLGFEVRYNGTPQDPLPWLTSP